MGQGGGAGCAGGAAGSMWSAGSRKVSLPRAVTSGQQ